MIMIDMTISLGDIIFLVAIFGLDVWIWGFWGPKDKKNRE
jgi:hypothetical protein